MGIYLSTPKTGKASEDGEDDKLKFGASSMQGWRSTMEDAHAALLDLDSSTAFFGVYDGHGGKQVAKFCAKYLHQQVIKQEAYSEGDLCTSLRNAFFRMDEMMRGERGWRELATMGDTMDQLSGRLEGLLWTKHTEDKDHNDDDDWLSEKGPHSNFKGPKYGSTACVAMIRDNVLVVANAGDSRCVISRNGQAFNMSNDHKPELSGEKERILAAGGFIYGGRVNRTLNLARAIGDMELKRDKSRSAEEQIVTANPDLRTVDLDDDDEFIILACDGIWDCMSSQELVDFVHEQLKLETTLSLVIEKVFDKCIAPKPSGAGCDNMTMVLVQFKNSSYYRNASTLQHEPCSKEHQYNIDSVSSRC